VAKALFEEIFCRYGTPKKILTDQGTNFMSQAFDELTKILNIKKLRTTPYHPQTDGQTERYNRTLINTLSCYVDKYQQDWDEFLPVCLFAYRSARHATTGYSPFELMYGRSCNLPIDQELTPGLYKYMDEPEYVQHMKEELPKIWRIAQDNIKFNQESTKELYDRSTKNHTFKIGDKVLINLPEYIPGTVSKLKRPYKGPFEVLEITPTNLKVKQIGRIMRKPFMIHVNNCKLAAMEEITEVPTINDKRDTKGVKRRIIKQPTKRYDLRERTQRINMLCDNSKAIKDQLNYTISENQTYNLEKQAFLKEDGSSVLISSYDLSLDKFSNLIAVCLSSLLLSISLFVSCIFPAFCAENFPEYIKLFQSSKRMIKYESTNRSVHPKGNSVKTC